MGKTLPYTVAHWNPGARPVADIVAVIVDGFKGNLTAQPWVAFHGNETGDLIKHGLAKKLEAAGYPCVLGPAGVRGARKVMLAWNPARLVPIEGGYFNVKLAEHFRGELHGHSFPDDDKYVLGQLFQDTATGRKRIHETGHTWPDVAHNKPEVRRYIAALALHLSTTKGPLVHTEDFNMTSANPLMWPLRDLGLVLDQDKFGEVPTFRPGSRGIDQGLVRERPNFKLVGREVLWPKGHEAGGGAHGILVLDFATTVRPFHRATG